jgi:hypothetical protein
MERLNITSPTLPVQRIAHEPNRVDHSYNNMGYEKVHSWLPQEVRKVFRD